MRLAVTGATGTVGSAFVKLAREAGHELLLLTRNAPKDLPDKCSWKSFDLTATMGGLAEDLAGTDCAVHLAARIDTNPVDDASANLLWTSNVLGTGKLIDALAKAGVGRFVMASSANIYDPSVACANENTAIKPQTRTLYLSSKAAQEAYARECCHKAKIECAILRISSVIGTGSDLASRFLEMVTNKETITLANPEYGADFVALQDVARGVLLAVEEKLSGEFNLSSGERQTLEDIVDTVAAVTGTAVQVNESGPHGALDRGFPAIDCAKLAEHGYEPSSLGQTIEQLWSEHRRFQNTQHARVSQ
ncbi:MAG: NAD(P)-dependent oxidoreductase [Pseudomonadota bacterium]